MSALVTELAVSTVGLPVPGQLAEAGLLHDLAVRAHLAGRLLDADESYRRALAIVEDCYGPDHVEVATICADLAALRSDHGDYDIAEALGRRSLRILQAVLGPEDTEVGRTMLNLAAALAGQDRLAEASAFADCARAILSDRLPDAHPYVLAARQAVSRLGEPTAYAAAW